MISAEYFTMCCLGPPAANPKPNTLGQWHTGNTGETLHQAYSLRHLSAWGEPGAPLLAGTCGAGEEGNARPQGGAGMPTGRMHRNNMGWDRNRDTHGHGHSATTAPGPEEQLSPLSVIPPLWLAWAGTFPCHKHPGRASASASAHAAPPRLRRCCCWLLQHLLQTSQQLQPRVIFPDQTHPTVQLPLLPSCKCSATSPKNNPQRGARHRNCSVFHHQPGHSSSPAGH